jgi:hypothetical protein
MISVTKIAGLEDKLEASDHPGKRIPMAIKHEILRAIGNIEYGSVEVTVHDGRVMQIESREKIRFSNQDATARK